MATLPKMMCKGSRATTVVINKSGTLTEALNVKRKNDNAGMYHKHREGICKTRHQGSNTCGGRVDWGNWNLGDTYGEYPVRGTYEADGRCTRCGKQYHDYVPNRDIENSPISGEHDDTTCNRVTGTYDYYTYSCGYDAE